MGLTRYAKKAIGAVAPIVKKTVEAPGRVIQKAKPLAKKYGPTAGLVLAGGAIAPMAITSALRSARSGGEASDSFSEPRAEAARRLVRKPVVKQAGAGQISYLGEEEELL